MNKNYCATVTTIEQVLDLPNCDKVRGTFIFGCHVIVGIETKPGDVGVFFPVETALSPEFLRANNLYRKPELNADPTKVGYFDLHGRVRAIKFRGHKSTGFFVPLSFFKFTGDVSKLAPGYEFDALNGIAICKKYIPAINPTSKRGSGGAKLHTVQSLKPRQFEFHVDTDNLLKNIHQLHPDQIIWVSYKYHGTSAVVAHLPIEERLPIWKQWLNNLGLTTFVPTTRYALVWSSRRQIKGIENPKSSANHYYGEDIWGVVARELESKIPEGMSIYGEIVGFTPSGSPIQRDYSYGCAPKEHKFIAYRVVYTTPDGEKLELTYPQLRKFCRRYNIEYPETYFYGHAKYLVPAPYTGYAEEGLRWWRKGIGEALKLEVEDQMCRFNPTLPMEGYVVKVETPPDSEDTPLFFKVKNTAFLEHESRQLDAGVVDIETTESSTE